MKHCGSTFVYDCCTCLCHYFSIFFLRCCRRDSSKVSAAASTRLIEVDSAAAADGKKPNKIKTSKYTLLTFLPKNLTEQFRRVVNFYFLIVTVVAIVIDSPVSPYTSIAPLSFMVLITSVKQGYEDWLRHRTDNVVNNQIVEIVHKGTIKEVRTASISAGTLVRVKRGRAVPADLLLLAAAGEGKCYVTTANLDGETNLKSLRVPPPLVGYTPDILPQGMRIEVPPPVADLYTFYGRLQLASGESLPLTTDNLMLRGSRVKNTEWAIGCAIYTGEETKLALNSRYTANKFSSCEVAVNGFLVFFIGILAVECLASYGMKLHFEFRQPGHQVYLGSYDAWPPAVSSVLQDMFSFLLLYYYIIPMSMYVTIELYKFIGALYIGWDEDLRCDETGRPAVANTSDLNEELGQVEVLFSDKTGTLTKNLMVFKACSINGRIYEERDDKLYDTSGFEEPEDVFKTDIKFFFTILALCHSVQISSDDIKRLSARLSLAGGQILKLFKLKKSSARSNGISNNNTIADVTGTNKIDYQASSPDEKALVEAAERVGVTFLGEDGNNLLVKVEDETEFYERLQVIEFTSERKRMSVIVKDKDGKIWLFCKGAESSVLPLCKNSLMVEETDRDINTFANKGLRTLAVAYREVPEHEYRKATVGVGLVDARADPAALQRVTQQYRALECSLTLLGATAVEDCLQDGVADTLHALRRADIRVWVLTGDKVRKLLHCLLDKLAIQRVTQQYRAIECSLTLLGATAVENCLQDGVADTLHALRRADIRVWVLTGDKVETAINVAQSCAHLSETDRRIQLVGAESAADAAAALAAGARAAGAPSTRELALVADGASMAFVLDSPLATRFVDLAMKCSAVLCCRLSPIQKAKATTENDRRIQLVGAESAAAALAAGARAAGAPSTRELALVADGASMAYVLDSPLATRFVDLAMKCSAVLCCRLSPIQKAKIVSLIKNSKWKPITAAIGDGANDISMIQEAHVGFGIFGKEGHQAARSADFAFTKFSMVKKILLVMGHWYYQRLATLIHYFFYKNLVFGNLMLLYQFQNGFSTQSIFDSMYLTLYNLLFSAAPCLVLSVTEQRWPSDLLLSNPTYYRKNTRNALMSYRFFAVWCANATYHSLIIFYFTMLAFRHLVISSDGNTIDLWCYGAVLFHYLVLIVNLKLWLHSRYQTTIFVASIVLSVLIYIFLNALYSVINVQFDGDVLGTYTRLLASPAFWFSNVLACVLVLLPDYCVRIASDFWNRRAAPAPAEPTVSVTTL